MTALKDAYAFRDVPGAALRGAVRRAAAVLRLWRRRRRERRDLAELVRLDERMLRDVGLTHGRVEFLINKPFWRE